MQSCQQVARFTKLSLSIAVLAVLMYFALPAEAAPGGIVKAAANNIWVQMGIGFLMILFAPLIVWYCVKRVRHIKAVKRDLERVSQLHPQYRWLDLRDRTTEIYTWVWSAWSQQKMDISSKFCTHWYWQNQQLKLNEWTRSGLENVCSLKRVVNIEPLLLQHEEGQDGSRVVLSITAEVTDYLKEIATGKIIEGDEKVSELETIWTLMWDEGQWKLNLIEASDVELSYLGMPSKLPASLQAGTPGEALKPV